MSELTPYRSRALAREQRQTAAILRAEQLPAKRAAARLQASALVAHVGMSNISLLTGLEGQIATRQGAQADARVAAVVDAYAASACNELVRLSLGGS
jgi:hypothetical protein